MADGEVGFAGVHDGGVSGGVARVAVFDGDVVFTFGADNDEDGEILFAKVVFWLGATGVVAGGVTVDYL